MDAAWQAPPTGGVTLWHVTDTHVDLGGTAEAITTSRLDSIADDLNVSAMTGGIHGRVHTGDITDDSTDEQIAWAKSWLAANLGTDRDTWVMGNHEYGYRYSTVSRDRASLEAAYGRSILSNTLVTGTDGTPLRVLGFSPDTWDPDIDGQRWTMPAETMTWLGDQLEADSTTPTFLACHYALPELVPSQDQTTQTQPDDGFAALISDYSNVVGWLSGHYHRVVTSQYTATGIQIGNRRSFPHINGPSAVFTQGVAGQDSSPYPYRSLFVTYRGTDRIEVRYRDHGARQWVAGYGGQQVTVLNPS